MRKNSIITKEKINKAAIALFVENGIDATTTKMIARKAGVAEGTLYRHYDSKDNMVLNLFLKNYISLSEEILSQSEKIENTIEKIQNIVQLVINKFQDTESRELIYFLLITQHSQINKIEEDLLTPVKVIFNIILKGIDKKEIKETNPELLTSMVFGLIIQPIQFSYYGKTLDLNKEIETIKDKIKLILGK